MLAEATVKAKDKVHFKRVLVPSAYHLDVAWKVCGLLAEFYPEQALRIAEVVRDFRVQREGGRQEVKPSNDETVE